MFAELTLFISHAKITDHFIQLVDTVDVSHHQIKKARPLIDGLIMNSYCTDYAFPPPAFALLYIKEHEE